MGHVRAVWLWWRGRGQKWNSKRRQIPGYVVISPLQKPFSAIIFYFFLLFFFKIWYRKITDDKVDLQTRSARSLFSKGLLDFGSNANGVWASIPIASPAGWQGVISQPPARQHPGPKMALALPVFFLKTPPYCHQ